MLRRPSPVAWTTTQSPRLLGAMSLIAPAALFCAELAGAQIVTPGDTAVVHVFRAAVLRSNPDLAARRAAVDAARARAAAVGFASPLVLAAEAEDVSGGLALSRAGSVRLDVSREFFGARRRIAARALAQTEVDTELAALNAAERRVLAIADRTVARDVLWTAVGRRLMAEDSLLASAESSLRTRFAVGEARYVDVLRLRTEQLRVRSEQAVAVTEALAARRTIDALLAPGDPDVSRVVALLDSLTRRELLLSTALAPAPDVDSLMAVSLAFRGSAAAVARARAARLLAIAEQRPRFAGFAGAQRFAADGGTYSLGPVLGASISLPFTARRANAAALAASDREIAAATAAREAALLGLRVDLQIARDRYEAARTRLAVFDVALLRGAREERETALASFRSGELALIELLDFERALARAETDRLKSRIDAADALADLLAGAFGSTGEVRARPAPQSSTSPN